MDEDTNILMVLRLWSTENVHPPVVAIIKIPIMISSKYFISNQIKSMNRRQFFSLVFIKKCWEIRLISVGN